MNIEIGHILVDVTLKSLVILGVPSLVTAFLSRRHFSANERFTILSASITMLVAMTIASLTIWLVSDTQSQAVPIYFGLEFSQFALNSIQAIWIAVALPLVLLTTLRITIAEWQCIIKTSNRVGADKLPPNVELNCPVILDEKCEFPCVKGILFRRVFVPTRFFNWPVSDQRNILLHERFHISRRDILWRCIADYAVSIFWFNPLVFYARSCLGLEQEISCDNGVLTTGVDGAQYSETILLVAKGRSEKPTLATSIRMSGHSGQCTAASTTSQFPIIQRLKTWSDMFQLRCRVLSIIDPRVCRRSLGVLAHTILFLGISLLSGSAFYASQLQDNVPITHTVLLQQQIKTSVDDAEENAESGTVSLDSRDLELCIDTGLEKNQLIGLRYSDLMIPKDATILSAKIVFTAYSTTPTPYSESNVDLEIFVQQGSSTQPFCRSKKDISRRLEGATQSIHWEINQPWTSGQSVVHTTTPELKDLVQARLQKDDWEPGNALVFVFKAKSFKSTRSAAAFDSVKPLASPKLRIVYSSSSN